MYKIFKRIVSVADSEYAYFWKSKGLSNERINSITVSNYSITPELRNLCTKIRVKFNGSCLKQDKITYTHGTIVNIYIVYEISASLYSRDFTLQNCLLQLNDLKMLILISTNIQVMALDLIH